MSYSVNKTQPQAQTRLQTFPYSSGSVQVNLQIK